MSAAAQLKPDENVEKSSREWVQILARYREPILKRSLFELTISAIPFVALWAAAWWLMSVSLWLSFGLAVVNSIFLLRLFLIQHDCGHGAFFSNRDANDWTGRVLGVLTLTPYDVWRRTHSMHHSSTGNLDRRGMGDVMTLTVEEYRAKSFFARKMYQLYRNPFVLFGLGPTYLFMLQNRLPIGLMKSGAKYWISAMGTNALLALWLFAIVYFGGWAALFVIFVPTTLIAASIGVWLFYVQHQFEETYWQGDTDWQLHDAALHGSSHYDLPVVLRWMTANIGIHHVHHLYSRIPFYRLSEVLRDHQPLAEAQRLTLLESFACVRFHLWDERQKRLLSFAEAHRQIA
ncbi:fatty acid desaturase [Cochlodiniinecator piscidefendens]|uniref:fatty acid desaturase n=1 Tax=Cochlodiniinecator piscidefendens TaxID=2715756 RepID=UPI00140C08DE|nr:fatty acid desaturase [Cochlodiniinecator piscidefendens]